MAKIEYGVKLDTFKITWRRCPPIHTILVSTTERPVQPALTQVPDVFRPGDQTAHRTQIVHEPQYLLVGKTNDAVVQRDERRQRLCAHDLLLAQEPPANHLVRQLRGERLWHHQGPGTTNPTAVDSFLLQQDRAMKHRCTPTYVSARVG